MNEDEEQHCCPQCGFAFMQGEVVAIWVIICPTHGPEQETLHPHPCMRDFIAGVPKELTRNKMIGLRRLN